MDSLLARTILNLRNTRVGARILPLNRQFMSHGMQTQGSRARVQKYMDDFYIVHRNALDDPVTEKALDKLGVLVPGKTLFDVVRRASIHCMRRYNAESFHENVVEATVSQYERTGQEEAGYVFCQEVLADWRMFADKQNSAILSEVLYLAAHRLWNSADWIRGPSAAQAMVSPETELQPVARFLLESSLEIGNLKAALDLAQMAHFTRKTATYPLALKVIRQAALSRTDARAMLLYARHLLNLDKEASPSNRELAFDLAGELCSAVEPGDPAGEIRLVSAPRTTPEPAWAILRDAAIQRLGIDHPESSDPKHQEINNILVETLRTAAYKYNDPRACVDLSNHPQIIEYSPEWIALRTKSAATGDADSCYHVARYHIEYWGWYPSTGQPPSKAPEAKIGLDWLDLSAQSALDNARVMGHRFKLLALLLRENGMSLEGHEVIRKGIRCINDYCGDHKWKTQVVRDLEAFDRAWDFPFTHRVHILLENEAEPILSPGQRRQNGEHSGWRKFFGFG